MCQSAKAGVSNVKHQTKKNEMAQTSLPVSLRVLPLNG